MGLKTETRLLGGHEYTVTQLGALAGREALRRLLKISTTAFSRAGDAWVRGGPEANGAAIFQGIMGLVQELEEKDLSYFCDVFGPFSTVRIAEKNPKVKDVFDAHFAGNYYELSLWLAFCVEVNFSGSFLGALEKLNARAPSPVPTPAPEST